MRASLQLLASRLEPRRHREYEPTLADGARLTSSRSDRGQVQRLLR